jgi:SAM-dependent methyltransferase
MGKCINARLSACMDGQTRLHRFRYHLGRGFVEPDDIVLDIGSGTGYGSHILSRVAKKVIGWELEESEVAGAVKNYQEDNISYVCANVEADPLPEVDVACAFEVIEHLFKPQEFINRLKNSVKRYIIASVPIGEKLMEDKQEVIGDSCHHSVFANNDVFHNMFVDEKWNLFWTFNCGVTLISVYYNNDIR